MFEVRARISNGCSRAGHAATLLHDLSVRRNAAASLPQRDGIRTRVARLARLLSSLTIWPLWHTPQPFSHTKNRPPLQ